MRQGTAALVLSVAVAAAAVGAGQGTAQAAPGARPVVQGPTAPAGPTVPSVPSVPAVDASTPAGPTGGVTPGSPAPGTSSSPPAADPAPPSTVQPSAGPALPWPGAVLVTAPEVLPGVGADAPTPTQAGLQRALSPVLRRGGLGGRVSAEVVDVATGRSLLSSSATRIAVPASTAKLFTGAAALSLLGPWDRLPTRTVDGTTADEIVLVGGGDVLLSAGRGDGDSVVGHGGLQDLAELTAAALERQGRTSVAVRLDDSLFAAPAVNPSWAQDVGGGHVAPVTALAVNAGTVDPRVELVPGRPRPRLRDPALDAARRFARLLAREGVRVTGAVVRAQAPAGSAALAQVESATVADLVEHALTDSDNTVAEALARLVAARSGRQATPQDAGVAVLDRVELLGVPVAGARLSSGSGLGTGNAVSARMLTRLLLLAASPEHPELRPLLTGLPVAGASGTLAERFSAGSERAGRGVVRAKTGTLTGASSLAGTVVDADGRQLAFVILADQVGSTLDARSALDDAAAVLAGCGCR